MGWAIRVFGSLFIVVYLLLSYYVGLRSFQALRAFFPSISKSLFWLIFPILVFSYIAEKTLGLSYYPLRLVGSSWMAAFFYLLLFFVLTDALGLFHRYWGVLPTSWAKLWTSRKIQILPLVLVFGIMLLGNWMAHHPYLAQYDIRVQKGAGGLTSLKIAMVSDLHVDALARTDYQEEAARTISALQPDLVFLAGDVVESRLDTATEEKMRRILAELKPRLGIYAVLGNHEYYGNQADEITRFLTAQGVVVLRDEAVTLLDGQLTIVGREDAGSGRIDTGGGKALEEILSGVDRSKPLLILDHQPKRVEEAKASGADLMVSGHTHGAQLFPAQFITQALYVADRSLWQEDAFHLIVSTGLGYWGPPIRTSSRSEIVLVNLHFD